MRNMSFFLTTEHIKNGVKTVTRRLKWHHARPGMMVMPIVKGQGLKRGESVEYLRRDPLRFIDTRWEPLNAITPEDVVEEGFLGRTPQWFVEMFLTSHGLTDPETLVHRIEFEYLWRCNGCHEYTAQPCHLFFGPLPMVLCPECLLKYTSL